MVYSPGGTAEGYNSRKGLRGRGGRPTAADTTFSPPQRRWGRDSRTSHMAGAAAVDEQWRSGMTWVHTASLPRTESLSRPTVQLPTRQTLLGRKREPKTVHAQWKRPGGLTSGVWRPDGGSACRSTHIQNMRRGRRREPHQYNQRRFKASSVYKT